MNAIITVYTHGSTTRSGQVWRGEDWMMPGPELEGQYGELLEFGDIAGDVDGGVGVVLGRRRHRAYGGSV